MTVTPRVVAVEEMMCVTVLLDTVQMDVNHTRLEPNVTLRKHRCNITHDHYNLIFISKM